MKIDSILGYKMFVAGSAAYTTNKLLDKKTDELIQEGGALNAFLIGAGQMAISIAVGVKVAKAIGKIL